MAIRVLLADDQELIRAGVAMLLEAEPDIEVVGQAEDGQQAVELAALTAPDVVLMDVRMPRLDGVAATALITADGFRPNATTISLKPPLKSGRSSGMVALPSDPTFTRPE